MKNQYPTLIDILAIVGIFVAVSGFVGMIVFLLLHIFDLPQGPVTAIAYALTMGGTLPVVLLLRRGRTPGMHWPVCLRFKPSWLAPTGWAVVMIFCVGIVLEPLLELFPKEWYERLDLALGKGGWAVLVAVVMAPILEEWLFRGVIQPPAVARYGPLRGILISAAVFAVIHFIPIQVIPAFAAGIVLGCLYHKTGSLVPVVLLHALNNGLSLLVGDTSATLREIIPQDTIYYTIYGASLALLGLGAVMMAKEFREQKKIANFVANELS